MDKFTLFTPTKCLPEPGTGWNGRHEVGQEGGWRGVFRPQAMASPRALGRAGGQGRRAGSRDGRLSLACGGNDTTFHSPHQRTTTALLYGFCFEHSDVGTCGHSCLRCPLSQKQTELPGCSFYHPLCFQALKYQSSLKKATEVEIRSSVSTGERVRPPDPWAPGLTHPPGHLLSPANTKPGMG